MAENLFFADGSENMINNFDNGNFDNGNFNNTNFDNTGLENDYGSDGINVEDLEILNMPASPSVSPVSASVSPVSSAKLK